jgi:hypothetical protein
MLFTAFAAPIVSLLLSSAAADHVISVLIAVDNQYVLTVDGTALYRTPIPNN